MFAGQTRVGALWMKGARSGRNRRGSIFKSRLDAGGVRDAALCHVFAAAASAPQFRHRLFQQCCPCRRAAPRIVRRPAMVAAKWSPAGRRRWTRAGQFLRQQFDEIQVAVGERAHDQLAAVGFRSFGQQRGSLGCGEFFLRLFALLAQRANFVERFAGLLRHVVDVGGKKRGGFGERGVVAARGGDGALSGDEFDAPSLSDFFDLS